LNPKKKALEVRAGILVELSIVATLADVALPKIGAVPATCIAGAQGVKTYTHPVASLMRRMHYPSLVDVGLGTKRLVETHVVVVDPDGVELHTRTARLVVKRAMVFVVFRSVAWAL
jgi:hypothetical protein